MAKRKMFREENLLVGMTQKKPRDQIRGMQRRPLGSSSEYVRFGRGDPSHYYSFLA
jgi:hypothetical protein